MGRQVRPNGRFPDSVRRLSFPQKVGIQRQNIQTPHTKATSGGSGNKITPENDECQPIFEGVPKSHQRSAKVALGHLESHVLKGAPKLHAGIPKRGLSNDEKADFKGNCIRFIRASRQQSLF